jgi:hypothetical protein
MFVVVERKTKHPEVTEMIEIKDESYDIISKFIHTKFVFFNIYFIYRPLNSIKKKNRR